MGNTEKRFKELKYSLCIKFADSTKIKYRRIGSVYRKDGEDVLKMD